MKPEIKLIWLQVKSKKKLKLLASLLDTMEKEFWIKETRITMVDCFICPDINIRKWFWSTPMQKVLVKIIL